MSHSPQKELGHIQIATGSPENDVLTAIIKAQLTGVEYQVALFILRKTWGYIDSKTQHPKKEDWICLDQFVDVTGRTHRGILNAIFSLEERKIIFRRKDGRKVYYGFNKTFHTWSILNSGSVNKSSIISGSSLNSCSDSTELLMNSQLNQSSDTKDNVTKTKITKTTLPIGNDGEAVESKPAIKKRKDIDEIINTMKTVLSLPVLDQSERLNRFAAKRLIDKIVKLCGGDHEKAMRNIFGAIQLAAEDKFWSGKLTSVTALERNFMQIVKSGMKEKQAQASSHLSL